jgi:hypothetical protein
VACGDAGYDAGETGDNAAFEPTASTTAAIYGGQVDEGDRANDAVVALRVGDSSPFELCTGALIAPSLVLTARHCVSDVTVDVIDCDERGRSRNGAHLGTDVAPSSIRVLLGTSPDLNGQPVARGRRVFHPGGDILCNADIAIVQLDREIKNLTPFRVRLEAPVAVGETLRAVGYGKNDIRVPLGTRLRKDDVKILTVGPAARPSSARPPVASREFEVGKSICQGDSGGPAINLATGAVVGVVSRGADCALDLGHIYTTTTGFEDLFARAFAAAGGSVLREVGGPSKLSGRDEGGAADDANVEGTQQSNAKVNLRSGANDKSCLARVAGGERTAPSFGAPLVALVAAAAAWRRRRARR